MTLPTQVLASLATNVSQRNAYWDNLGLCMFKGLSITTFVSEIQEKYPSFKRMDFQEAMRNEGTLHTTIRLFLYSKVHAAFNEERSPSIAAAGLPEEYVPFVKHLLRRDSNTYALLWSYAKQELPCFALDRFQRVTQHVLLSKDLQDYIGKFINAKFRFLTNGGVLTKQEIRSDLITVGLYSLARAYPMWRDVGHMHAIAKTAIHNHGQNMITAYASQKRVHLQRGDSGAYEAVGISLDAASLVAEGFDSQQRLVTMPEEESLTDTLMKVSKFDSLAEWQRSYLRLVLGEEDAGFAEYLGEDVDDVRHALSFERFNGRVCRYLNLQPEAASTFLRSLRTVL